MAEEKAADGTMLCVSYSEVVPIDEAKPDDVSFIKLGRRPVPEPGDDDVLLAVKTSSMNPVDFKLAHWPGAAEALGATLPIIVGVDVAGVVEKVGKNVESLQVGDEVWAYSGYERNGGWAEKCAVLASRCGKKPKAFSWELAGCLGCAVVTAMTAIVKVGFKEGDTVAVRGASGGTGLFLLQLLKNLGAAGVAAVCSGRNAGLVKEYGATEVIDYSQGDVAQLLAAGGARFDAYFDFAPDGTGGVAIYKQAAGFLKPGAQTVFISETGTDKEAVDGYPVASIMGVPTAEVMGKLAAAFEAKPFRAEIMETFALKDWEQAFRISKGHRARGKICIKVDPSA